MNANTPLATATLSTTAQVTTLLSCLKGQQTPPFTMLFWSGLQQVGFDDTPVNIARLGQLLDRIKAHMAQKNLSLPDLVQQPGAANFFFAVSAYLGDYIAKTTGQTATWYRFDELAARLAAEHAAQQVTVSLPPTLDNSLIASIGGVYCRPLGILAQIFDPPNQPMAEATSSASQLHAFIGDMQNAILASNQVNLLDDPNQVAYQYLEKLKTGRLLDTTVGHAEYFHAITFDYSQASLHAIDDALTALARAQQVSQADYAAFIAQPANQALLYLLGFYIGTASSVLANVPSKWANYEEMLALFREDDDNDDTKDTQEEHLVHAEGHAGEADFSHCIEHSFVQLMDGHFRTPILVVTNRLFGIAPNFPSTAVEFAQRVAEQNRAALHLFITPTAEPITRNTGANLPANWQQVVPSAAALLEQNLQAIVTGDVISPSLWQLETPTTAEPTLLTLTGADNDNALDQLYQQLTTQAHKYACQVAVFGLTINLPMGQCDGLALEIRVAKPALALQLLLPYRYVSPDKQYIKALMDTGSDNPSGNSADNSGDNTNKVATLSTLADAGQLVLYPFISNQSFNGMDWEGQIQPLVNLLYQTLTQGKLAQLWQAHRVPVLDLYAAAPSAHRAAMSGVAAIDIPLLAFADTHNALNAKAINAATRVRGMGLALSVARFDYQSLSWLGYDAPKHILATAEREWAYLQVVVPDALVNDPLFSQVEAMQRLYQYGKVVWAVVVRADAALGQFDAQVADALKPSAMLSADLLYDPTGQAGVDVLLDAATALMALQGLSDSRLSPQQALYLAHWQDTQSRIFQFAYPADGHQARFAHYHISSSWVWRRHLPDGVLAIGDVVPMLLEPQRMDSREPKGRVMVLPSRFWRADFYRYWLVRTQQRLGLLELPDLMPAIVWQEQQGLRYSGKGLDSRIFPKFKFLANATNTAMGNHLADGHAIPTHSPVSAELQQQLLAEQARLQAQLSTKDSAKERQLYLIIALVIGAMLLLWASSKWLG